MAKPSVTSTFHTSGALSLDELIDSLVVAHRSSADPLPFSGPSTCLASTRTLVEEELGALVSRMRGEEDMVQLDRLREWLDQELVRLQACFAERGDPRPSWASGHSPTGLCDNRRLVMVNALDLPPAEAQTMRPLDRGFDLAALLVGLAIRGETRLANRALDRYLRLSGDYALTRLLPVFQVACALSGARRALQRRPEAVEGEPLAHMADAMAKSRRYLALAETISVFRFPPLIIGVGVSGSGKSRFTANMAENLGAVRLCSDVERRRLHGIDPQAVGQEPPVDIFTADATARTYQRLAGLAGTLLDAGFTTCLDATCLTREQRKLLCQQAEARGLPVLIVSFEADDETLKSRIVRRAQRQGALPLGSLEVLRRQQSNFEPFDDEERQHLVHLDTAAKNATDTLVALIRERLRL
ncbi:AAA family ATPase [Billgrantia montanilacus]|uniref:ATP-binding protein n=1 Tax=Billgrantia montanilacus TaxID=2282305 RepID=A0A368U2B5_9GAMM|nr:bifunctional aminoglycoside phosphotransferase/ATP-binding protein [Halomonas montanilacus]RCV90607.1 ATP-binding protein [Halomonas montanilacus]